MSRFNLRSRKTLKLSTQKQCSKCQRHMFCDDEINGDDDQKEVICVDCERQPNIEPEVKKPQRKRKLSQVPATKVKIERHDDSENKIHQSSDGMSYANQINTIDCTPISVHSNLVLMKSTTNNSKNCFILKQKIQFHNIESDALLTIYVYYSLHTFYLSSRNIVIECEG